MNLSFVILNVLFDNQQIGKVGDDHVGNRLVVGFVSPTLTLEPCCAAARLLGRQDVLVEAVADDEDFV
jgi:hypothetical protein